MDKAFMEQLWSQRSYGTPLAITFMVIPTVSIALRFYAKLTARRPIEVSDYLSITAWIFTVAFLACMLVAVYLPASYADSPNGIDTPVSKITFTLNLLWLGGCYFCKLSILCVYYSLLATPSSRFRWAVRITFVLTAAVGLASALGFLLVFRDLSWWWTPTLRQNPALLVEEVRMNLAVDIMSLLTDVIIIVLPLPVLLRLSLSPHKKRVLVVLFSLGFLTCIEVIIRIITTYAFNGALDAIQIQCLLMALEPVMGVTICSLPVFLRLFRKSSQPTSSYYKSTSAGPGSFYPIDDSATKRLKQDHDEILLQSIDIEPIQQPRAVKVKNEIIIQSSVIEHHGSQDSLKPFFVTNTVARAE